jgi:predicted phage baseplate assembly protein
MPIQSPQLDDLRYDRILEELTRRIPVHTPEWTDHNDSDPGITLIQLFAHLAELTGYRLNRVPEKNHIELLKLLGVRLEPAHAATTQVAFLHSAPGTRPSFTLRQSARTMPSTSSPPSRRCWSRPKATSCGTWESWRTVKKHRPTSSTTLSSLWFGMESSRS